MGGIKAVKLKKDTVFKEFWRDNERFADLFNGAVFNGQKIVDAKLLQEMDTEVSGIIEFHKGTESLVRSRDIIKKAACGIEYIVMGIEDQEHIHYAMPLRNMIYDGLGYLKEYKLTAKEMRTIKSADEFLSQMGKGDRLHPIITLTVYYGEKPWDGPRTLKDMVFEMPSEVGSVFADYPMNLIEVRDSGKYIFQNEEVSTAFEISRDIFAGNIDHAVKKYGHVPLRKEVWNFISTITDAKGLLAESYDKEDDNMCEALERWGEEKTAQGIEQNMRYIVKNMRSHGLSCEKIAEITGVSEKEIKAFAEPT